MILHLLRKFTAPTETFIADQINATNALNPKVFAIRNLSNLEVMAKIFSSENVDYLSCKFLGQKSLNFFKENLKYISPKIIHAHYLTDASFFHTFSKHLDIPKICSCYGYDVSSFPKKFGGLAKIYYQRVFKEYQFFLAMSDVMKADLIALGCPEQKILVHYYGVNTNLFSVERNYKVGRTFNLLTIARLQPMKGHLTVLKALIIMKNVIPVTYYIVGDGPNEKVLKNFVKLNGLDGIVKFRSAIKHGPEFNSYLREANVFLHPSEIADTGAKEGIPGAIVEAMSSGLPVISTFHAGIPEIISHNSTGFLINERDFRSLAEILILLYRDELLRRRIGNNARKYANDNLNLFLKANQLKQIYFSLLTN